MIFADGKRVDPSETLESLFPVSQFSIEDSVKGHLIEKEIDDLCSDFATVFDVKTDIAREFSACVDEISAFWRGRRLRDCARLCRLKAKLKGPGRIAFLIMSKSDVILRV